MSDFLNFGDLEASAKKDPANSNEKSSKMMLNEKAEHLLKKKKKMTNISDPSILEADILNESYSEISNNQIIRETIENLNHLFIEEDSIISRIIEFSYDANSLYRTRDLFDALFYEFKIRYQNKTLALKQLKDKEEQNFEYIKNLENNLKKTQNELIGLKKFQETKQFRHGGKIKIKSDEDLKDLDIFGWILDIDSIYSVLTAGWKLYFNPLFYEGIQFTSDSCFSPIPKPENAIKDPPTDNLEQSLDPNKPNERVVSLIGLYDKGKSFVLANLTSINLPSEKKVVSRGVSFKEFFIEETKLILLDTVGSYAPVTVTHENSVKEKELTELFLLDLVFELSDYFIFVMNEFSAVDQRYLDKLSKMLKAAKHKSPGKIIVVHNFKEVESQEILDQMWETQVRKVYGEGGFHRTKVLATNPVNGKLQEKHVHWFQTNDSRHVRLANDDCMLGNSLNAWTFSLMKLWLTTESLSFVKEGPFSIKSVMEVLGNKLEVYLGQSVGLEMRKSEGRFERVIKVQERKNEDSACLEGLSERPLPKEQEKPEARKLQRRIENDVYVVSVDVGESSIDDFVFVESEKSILIKKKGENDDSEGKCKNEGIFLLVEPPENFPKKSDVYVEKGVLFMRFPRKPSKKEQEESENNSELA